MKWKELEEHFHGLGKSLKRRFHELEGQEKEFKNKTMKAREILEKREADVFAREQASLQRLQEKRDAAVFAIVNAREKHRRVSSHELAIVSDDHGTHGREEKPVIALSMAMEVNFEDLKLSSESGNVEVLPYPELVKLCKEMDAGGLHKFISDNLKNLASVREEVTLALIAAPNAAHLVLDSLERFFCVEVLNHDLKDANILGLHRSCIMLMECSVLLTNSDSVANIISEDMKNKAKAIAEKWKPRLDALDMDASNGNSLEAHAFLQLLASFDIASDFNEELSRLILIVSRCRQTADLC